jgi:hypothetical protein
MTVTNLCNVWKSSKAVDETTVVGVRKTVDIDFPFGKRRRCFRVTYELKCCALYFMNKEQVSFEVSVAWEKQVEELHKPQDNN